MQLTYPSIINGMPEDVYHSRSELSSSDIRKVMASPAKYQYAKLTPPETKTEAQALGTATHVAVLEPETFESRYYTPPSLVANQETYMAKVSKFLDEHYFSKPEGNARTNAYKEELASLVEANPGKEPLDHKDKVALMEENTRTAIYKQFRQWLLDQHPGKELISAADSELVLKLKHAVWNNPTAKDLLAADGMCEQSIFWEEQGVACRLRGDRISDNYIVDLKTTEDASPEGFAKSVYKWGYHIQAAYYLRGIKAATGKDMPFYFIAVEKSAPYLTAVYRLDATALAIANGKIDEGLKQYRDCKDSATWPGYSTACVEIGLPGYTQPKQGKAVRLGDLEEHVYITVPEAAAMVGKNRMTVSRWCRTKLAARKKDPNRRNSPWEVKVADFKRFCEREGITYQ